MPKSAEGLREALALLNEHRQAIHERAAQGAGEPPYWMATNALLTEIANREGKSIAEVATEFRELRV